jgi:hypothetical protein
VEAAAAQFTGYLEIGKMAACFVNSMMVPQFLARSKGVVIRDMLTMCEPTSGIVPIFARVGQIVKFVGLSECFSARMLWLTSVRLLHMTTPRL